jgi:hypothetical protein
MRNKEAGQKTPGIFALEAQGLCSELHQGDAEKKRPSQGFRSRGLPITSEPVRRIGLGPPLGRDPGRGSQANKANKALALSVIFLNDPTETTSVMYINDLTGTFLPFVASM